MIDLLVRSFYAKQFVDLGTFKNLVELEREYKVIGKPFTFYFMSITVIQADFQGFFSVNKFALPLLCQETVI